MASMCQHAGSTGHKGELCIAGHGNCKLQVAIFYSEEGFSETPTETETEPQAEAST